MSRSFRKYFDDFLLPSAVDVAGDREHRMRLATAALLIEMTRADFAEQPSEHDHALRLLVREFRLSHQEAIRLAELGGEEARTAVSLYEFAETLDKSLAVEDKIRIVEMLWEIAYADGDLDKYEEHLMRKLADLLHVSHRQNTQTGARTVVPTGPTLLQLDPGQTLAPGMLVPASGASAAAIPQTATVQSAADAVPEKNDFQDFINQTTGQKLPLYGYDLFRRAPSTFAPVETSL